MTIIDTEFYSDEEDSALRETNSNTPDLFAFDCGQLPFERMGDDHFELLLADLYSAQADDGSQDWYDKARRLNDGADQGRDVILILDSAPVGVIQCKRYNGIVSLDMIIKEICKFFLYAAIRPGIASALGEPFRYYVAVSDRAAGKLTCADASSRWAPKGFGDALHSLCHKFAKVGKKRSRCSARPLTQRAHVCKGRRVLVKNKTTRALCR